MSGRTARTASARERPRRVGRHEVRKRVQELILSGRLPPGSKLVQLHLADQFGVSQAIVREALLELKAVGLVESIDNRGMFVADLSGQRLLESLEVRAVLEAWAARICCETASRADLRPLVDLAEHVYALGIERKLNEMTVNDRRLHDRIIELSGNRMIMRLAEEHRTLGLIIRVGRDPGLVRREHLAVLGAIERRRPDAAERLMREHIFGVRKVLQKQIERGAFVPTWLDWEPSRSSRGEGGRPDRLSRRARAR